ncbi:MAG: protein-disulfide reductase DsbD domain-containing protein [Kordiimonas sp.]
MRKLLLSVVGVVSGFHAAYADATDWVQHQDMLKTRLITASSELSPAGKILLAWEAKLAPGWKTYWRSPGEAGLPVRVFSEGDEKEVQYPFPERFELFGLETFGYSDYVVLPFELDAKRDQSTVAVDVDFMVCKEICVPFKTTYELENISVEDISIHDGKFRKWSERVPAVAGDDDAGLDIKWAKVVGPVGRQKIIAEVSADTGLSDADMLVEVNDMFHFGKPKMKLLADGRTARFVLPAMTGKMPEDLRGKKARLTFTNGRGASIERTLDLPSKHNN